MNSLNRVHPAAQAICSLAIVLGIAGSIVVFILVAVQSLLLNQAGEGGVANSPLILLIASAVVLLFGLFFGVVSGAFSVLLAGVAKRQGASASGQGAFAGVGVLVGSALVSVVTWSSLSIPAITVLILFASVAAIWIGIVVRATARDLSS